MNSVSEGVSNVCEQTIFGSSLHAYLETATVDFRQQLVFQNIYIFLNLIKIMQTKISW